MPEFAIWRDSANVATGSFWESSIEEALRSSDLLIVLLTPRWIHSEWCRKEYLLFEQIESVRNVGPCVIPILAKDVARQVRNFTDHQRDVYNRILKRQLKPLLSTDFLRQSDAERTLQIEIIANDVTDIVERIRENSATDRVSHDKSANPRALDSPTFIGAPPSDAQPMNVSGIAPPTAWATPRNSSR